MPSSLSTPVGRSPPPTGAPRPAAAQRGITRSAALKGHVAVDPDSEIVTDTVVSAGNVGDAAVSEDLIEDLCATTTSTDGERETEPPPTVYGDCAYGSGPFLDRRATQNAAAVVRPAAQQ